MGAREARAEEVVDRLLAAESEAEIRAAQAEALEFIRDPATPEDDRLYVMRAAEVPAMRLEALRQTT